MDLVIALSRSSVHKRRERLSIDRYVALPVKLVKLIHLFSLLGKKRWRGLERETSFLETPDDIRGKHCEDD